MGLGVAMIVGVVEGVTAGNGVGVCPNTEQTNRKVMMRNCVAILSDNLIKRIRSPDYCLGRALRELLGPNKFGRILAFRLTKDKRARRKF